MSDPIPGRPKPAHPPSEVPIPPRLALGGCIDGQITMILQGNRVVWQWSGSWKGKGYAASGTFDRR